MKIAVTKDRVLFLVYVLSGTGVIVWTGNVWAMLGGSLLFLAFITSFSSLSQEQYDAGYTDALKQLPAAVDHALREYRQQQTRMYDGSRWRKIGKDC